MSLTPGSDGIVIKGGKNTVIDLNGQTIDATSIAGESKDAVFAVRRGGTLTLNGDGSVDGSKTDSVYTAVKLTVKNDSQLGDPANVVINGGTYKGTYYAVTGSGLRQNVNLVINNGTFIGTTKDDAQAVYHPQDGVATLNDGTYSGSTCVVVKAGKMTINGGTYVADGKAETFVHQAGWKNTGDCIAIEACDYPGTKPIVEINGGTFTSVNAKPVASYAQTGYTRITKFVKGGKFNKELDADLIADGYEQVQDGDWWIVKQI